MILPKPTRTLVNAETALLDLDPEQVKRHKGSPEHATRTDNIRLHGILEPLTGRKRANGRYAVLSGNGRGLSAIELKLETVPMLLLSEGDTNDAVCVLVANLLRKDLTLRLLLEGVEGIKASEPSWMNKDIALQIGMAESRVSQLLAIGACPFARAELVEGRMSINEAYAVARAEPDAKAGLIALKAAGAPSHEITKTRKPREVETVKASRTIVPLSTGIKVQVSGPELDLAGLIDALSSSLDAAKRAQRDHLDIKTFAKVAADRAKAGA